MNQKKIIQLSVLLLLFFVSCKEPHEHSYSNDWSYDKDFHWHEATCEHKDEVNDFGPHLFSDGVVVKEATVDTEGELLYTCTVCGYSLSEVIAKKTSEVNQEHVHTFSKEWKSDADYHWHEATCEHSQETSTKIPHSWIKEIIKEPTKTEPGSLQYTCMFCGYTQTFEIDTLPNDIIPKKVSKVQVETFSNQITIKWQNPEDENLEKVLFMRGGDILQEFPGNPGEECSVTVTNLQDRDFLIFSIISENNYGIRASMKIGAILCYPQANVNINGCLAGLGLKYLEEKLAGKFYEYSFSFNVIDNIIIGNEEIENSELLQVIPEGFSERICIKSSGSSLYQNNRKIRLDAFAISQYPITRNFYQKVMGVDPSQANTNETPGNNPVTNVSWIDAIKFCNELSRLTGLEQVYTIDSENNVTSNLKATGYRLPTETEWEYCARDKRYNYTPQDNEFLKPFGWFAVAPYYSLIPTEVERVNNDPYYYISHYAWHKYNVLNPDWKPILDPDDPDYISDEAHGRVNPDTTNPCYGTHEVGLKPTQLNGFWDNNIPLFDMLGNVWEWCNDYAFITTKTNIKNGKVTSTTLQLPNDDILKLNSMVDSDGFYVNPMIGETNYSKSSTVGLTTTTLAISNEYRIVRGGSYREPDSKCTSISRYFKNKNEGYDDVGFRICRSLPYYDVLCK